MNKLIKIINSFSGNVLCIGISEELTDIVYKNNNIINCDILSNSSKTGKSQIFSKKNNTVNINQIKKKYKKKRIDYIICNYEIIKPYIKKFIKNSVYINKNKLYFYNNIDSNLIKSKYSRYNTKIKEYKDIIEIDNTNSKINILKELFYNIKDTLIFLIEIIGDILMG